MVYSFSETRARQLIAVPFLMQKGNCFADMFFIYMKLVVELSRKGFIITARPVV